MWIHDDNLYVMNEMCRCMHCMFFPCLAICSFSFLIHFNLNCHADYKYDVNVFMYDDACCYNSWIFLLSLFDSHLVLMYARWWDDNMIRWWCWMKMMGWRELDMLQNMDERIRVWASWPKTWLFAFSYFNSFFFVFFN